MPGTLCFDCEVCRPAFSWVIAGFRQRCPVSGKEEQRARHVRDSRDVGGAAEQPQSHLQALSTGEWLVILVPWHLVDV